MKTISCILLLAAIPALAAEPCLERAAAEFNVPTKVLDAMRQENSAPKNDSLAKRTFGPMGLVKPAIQLAQRLAGIENAKTDACQNYRAAAWLLAEARTRAGGDLWEGIGHYYVVDLITDKRKAMAEIYIARIKKGADELSANYPKEKESHP